MDNTFEKRIHQHIIFNGTQECFEDVKDWLTANKYDGIDLMSFHQGLMFVPTVYGIKTVKNGDLVILRQANQDYKLTFLVIANYDRFDIEARGVCSPKPAVSLN